MTASELEPPRPRSRRRWLMAALILTVVAAAGALLLLRDRAPAAEVGCYAAASLDADTAVVTADGRRPADVCAELWAGGELAIGAPAPRVLEACVVPGGAVGVFPGDRSGICDRLGLPIADNRR